MNAESSMKKQQRWRWFYYLMPPIILAVASLFFYWPSRYYAFQFDDIANITKHYHIRHYTFSKIFFSSTRWVSNWLNAWYYHYGKLDPCIYRMGNICMHTILGLLIFLFLLLTLSHLKKSSFVREHALLISFFTAGLFLLHPVQTQTVSYAIQGQMEGAASFMIMSMALCFWTSQYVRQHIVRLFFYLLLFALALIATGTKEIAIVSPLLLILVDWFLIAEGSWQDVKKRWWLHAIVAVLVWGSYGYLLGLKFFGQLFMLAMQTENNQGNMITQFHGGVITSAMYCLSQFKVILHYLWIFLWPFNISVEYDWVLSRSFWTSDCLFPFLILMVIGCLIVYLLWRNRANLVAFGLLWFFIYIIPRSSIIPSGELIVDYKTYGASIGWLLVLAIAIIFAAYYLINYIKNYQKISRVMLITASSILLLLCGIQTMRRNTVWRSGIEFWGSMLKTAPGKPRIYNNYGVELSQTLKKYEEAIPYYKKAMAMDRYYPDPHTNLAMVYARTDQIDLAIREMMISLRLNPQNPEAYNNISVYLSRKKDFINAEKAIQSALALRPTYGKAFVNYANLYRLMGKPKAAMEKMRTAVTNADLDNEQGYWLYGKLAVELAYFNDALIAFNKLLAYNPHNGEALFHLGHTYVLQKDFRTAITYYERARISLHNDPRTIFYLGECHVKLGDIMRAMRYLEQIRYFIAEMPAIAIRLADCYARIGRHQRAENLLHELLKQQVPDDIKEVAQHELTNIAQLKQRRSIRDDYLISPQDEQVLISS